MVKRTRTHVPKGLRQVDQRALGGNSDKRHKLADQRAGNGIEVEQLKPGVPAPEKLVLGSGLNSLLSPKERQAKWNLTEAEVVFAKTYVETGDFQQAYKRAGIVEKTAHIYLTRERIWAYVEKYLSVCLTRGAVVGYNIVLDLAENSKAGDTLRFKAASWLYDKWENRILRDAGVFAARTDTPGDLNAIQARIGELSRVLNLNIQVNLPTSERSDYSSGPSNGQTVESEEWTEN
jgi:hypothetical protein